MQRLWRVLERQSLVRRAERRMEKTCLISRFAPSLMSQEALEAIFGQREPLPQRLVDLIREGALTHVSGERRCHTSPGYKAAGARASSPTPSQRSPLRPVYRSRGGAPIVAAAA